MYVSAGSVAGRVGILLTGEELCSLDDSLIDGE